MQSRIVTYRPFLLSVGLDCGDWDPQFVQFVREVFRTSSEDFCKFDEGANIGSLPLVIAAAIILLVVLRMFAARSV